MVGGSLALLSGPAVILGIVELKKHMGPKVNNQIDDILFFRSREDSRAAKLAQRIIRGCSWLLIYTLGILLFLGAVSGVWNLIQRITGGSVLL